MEGDEEGIEPHRRVEPRTQFRHPAARYQTHPIAVGDARRTPHIGVDLDAGFGFCRVQSGNSARLRTGLIMRRDAAGREVERVVAVGLFSRWAVFDRMKYCAPIGCSEMIEKQTRSARMIQRRARPEHPVGGSDAVVSDAAVVCRPSSTGAA